MNKHLSAFMYWYQVYEEGQTEYIYIIAYSQEEAFGYFVANGYTLMYDYARRPVDTINEDQFYRSHNDGEVLGENAII